MRAESLQYRLFHRRVGFTLSRMSLQRLQRATQK
jgi:hypothetical protein